MLLCFTFSCRGLAQQNNDTPATKEDVQRYFEVTESREMVKKMMDAMVKPLNEMIHEDYTKDKLPDDYEDRMTKRMDDMVKNMPWEEMTQAMVPTYQKHFTKGDIDALVTFYSSQLAKNCCGNYPKSRQNRCNQ